MESKKTTTTKTKKPTTKKSVNKKTEEVIDKPMTINDIPEELLAQIIGMVQKAQTGTTEEVKEVKIKDKFTKSMLSEIENEKISVRSSIKSVVFSSPKSNITYIWDEKGDVETMTVKDVLAMERKSRLFLHTPWLIVEDERVVEALGLESVYKLVEKVEDFEELIQLDTTEIRDIFGKLPKEYKKSFINEIYTKVKTGELNNLTLIRELEQILKIELI